MFPKGLLAHVTSVHYASGKTTVALHRIAYLAYVDPRIDSERSTARTLSASPSNAKPT